MTSIALGIDLGTSAVKAVLTRAGEVIGIGSASLTLSSPRPGWSEQDPSDWIKGVIIAVSDALEKAGVSGTNISGISLSGQMHGAVLLDKFGEVIRPAILWNDNRSVAECAQMSEKMPNIGQIGGVPPLPGFTAPKLMWIKKHETELFKRIHTVLLPKDYLAFWLTNNASTDFSDAAGTLWLDQSTRAWSDPLMRVSGINPDWLPALSHGFDRVGEVQNSACQALGLKRNIPVFAGAGDAAAGALSIGAASAGRCFISLGTSGQLLVVDDEYRPNPDQFVHAYCHTLPNTWFRMAAMLNGARPLAWFASVLHCSVTELLNEAEKADSQRVPIFLPYLTGERSPHGDPDIRSVFYGLEDATGRPEMCRAIVEAIAFMMRDSMDSFGESFAPSAAIPVIGGGSRSDLVLQTLATVLAHPVTRAADGVEGPAYGAALLAETGLGSREISDLSFEIASSAEFRPMDDPITIDRLQRYRDLYKALKGKF